MTNANGQVPVLQYANCGLVVLLKPSGLIVQGNGRRTELIHFLPDYFENGQWCGSGQPPLDKVLPAHRIDKATHGLLIAATPEVRTFLHGPKGRDWHTRTSKRYLAIIERPRWTFKQVSEEVDGKPATTEFKILQAVPELGLAVVQCSLVNSGRKHQIRKHLQSLGYPIVGDRLYGGRNFEVELASGKIRIDWTQLLAHKLRIDLPADQRDGRGKLMLGTETLIVQAPVPPSFRALIPDAAYWQQVDNFAVKEAVASIPIPGGTGELFNSRIPREIGRAARVGSGAASTHLRV